MRYLGAKDTFFFIVCYRGFCTAQQNRNAMEIDTGIFLLLLGKLCLWCTDVAFSWQRILCCEEYRGGTQKKSEKVDEIRKKMK